MDSRLDSIFRATFQPAEKTDTWQGIRREEPQNDQRRKHHKEKINKEDSPEDNATLSVEALHGFLKTLLVQAGEQPEPKELRSPTIIHESGNKMAAQAASAYQSTARSVPGARINLTETTPSPTTPDGPTIALSGGDLRIIHTLLVDVETLADHGIGTINLHPGDRFLDSLVSGVQEALLKMPG